MKELITMSMAIALTMVMSWCASSYIYDLTDNSPWTLLITIPMVGVTGFFVGEGAQSFAKRLNKK